MANFLLFCCIALLPGDDPQVLVLKNGKTIHCDHYEQVGGNVRITKGEQTFSLPGKLVDWDRSKAETARLQEKRAEKKEPPKKKAPQFKPKKPTKKISLTYDDYKKLAKIPSSKPVTTNFRQEGNHIIVDLVINGDGPFKLILDTGAAATVISPRLFQLLGLTYTGEETTVVGVAGRGERAGFSILDEISLSGARVNRLKVVVKSIPQLNLANIHGLLGQDFLKNFVLNIDSVNQTVTLTPQRAVASTDDVELRTEEILRDPEKPFRDLERIIRGTFVVYQNFNRNAHSSSDAARLKGFGADLPAVQGKIRSFYNALQNIPNELLSSEDKRKVLRFNSCYGKIELFMNDFTKFSRALRTAIARPADQRSGNSHSSLEGLVSRLEKGNRDLEHCFR